MPARQDHEGQSFGPPPQPESCPECRAGWVALNVRGRWKETPCCCSAGEWVMEYCRPWRIEPGEKRNHDQILNRHNYRRMGERWAAERRRLFKAGDLRYAPRGHYLRDRNEPARDDDIAVFVPTVF